MIDRIEFYYGDDPETPDKATLTERHYILTVGSEGEDLWQFDSPADIAVDADCNVYVADAGNNRVQQFDRNLNFNELWTHYTLNSPRGICYDGGWIYVANNGNNRVVQLNSTTGALVAEHTGGFSSPCDVAATGATMFVADTGNNRLMRATYDYELETWSTFVKWPDAQTSFTAPTRLARTGDGYLYIVESGVDGGRVRKFNVNGTEVQNELWQTDPVGNAGGIAVDGKGRVYICDVESNQMKRYSADGTFEAAWGGNGPGTGGSGTGAGQFDFSDALGCGVAVSSALTGPTAGYIYVADSGNDRVQRFAAEKRMRFCGVLDESPTELTITATGTEDPVNPGVFIWNLTPNGSMTFLPGVREAVTAEIRHSYEAVPRQRVLTETTVASRILQGAVAPVYGDEEEGWPEDVPLEWYYQAKSRNGSHMGRFLPGTMRVAHLTAALLEECRVVFQNSDDHIPLNFKDDGFAYIQGPSRALVFTTESRDNPPRYYRYTCFAAGDGILWISKDDITNEYGMYLKPRVEHDSSVVASREIQVYKNTYYATGTYVRIPWQHKLLKKGWRPVRFSVHMPQGPFWPPDIDTVVDEENGHGGDENGWAFDVYIRKHSPTTSEKYLHIVLEHEVSGKKQLALPQA